MDSPNPPRIRKHWPARRPNLQASQPEVIGQDSPVEESKEAFSSISSISNRISSDISFTSEQSSESIAASERQPGRTKETKKGMPAKSYIPTQKDLQDGRLNICALQPTTAFPRARLDTARGLFPEKSLSRLYLDYLLTEYKTWRKNREDVNAFYRAVGIQYIELLCSPCIEVREFEAFIAKLDSNRFEFKDCKTLILEFPTYKLQLDSLLILKTRGESSDLFVQLERFIVDRTFDSCTIKLMRILTANYLFEKFKIVEVFGTHDTKLALYNHVLGDNPWDQFDAQALANVLQVVIVVESSPNDNFTTEVYRPWMTGRYYKIALWYRPQNTFDCIYSEVRSYADGFSLKDQEYKETAFGEFTKTTIKEKLKVDAIFEWKCQCGVVNHSAHCSVCPKHFND
jgi:hypothetical protein